MERSKLCSKLKQESISNATNRSMSMNYKFKSSSSSWDNWKEGDLLGAAGFSWPPRSYTCSFCKREFRSAQALGGHMNVHRRDRARLRLSPSSRSDNNNNNIIIGCNRNAAAAASGKCSTVNLNLDHPNPNLNTNPNLSSLLTKFPQFSTTLPPICPLLPVVEKSCEFFNQKKSDQLVRLDLEIGNLFSQSKEELDLELRLGYT